MKLDKATVGKRYAKALFELATEVHEEQAVYEQLLVLRQVFIEVADLGEILSDVRLEMTEKKAILSALTPSFDPLIQNFLAVVFEYNRMDDLLLIIDEYERRFDDKQGLIIGTVTTAVELTAQQKSAIEMQIAPLLGYEKAQLTEQIDPTIIGGVVVEANHQVVDGSVKSRLEELRMKLSE
ncbi:MULTISPECIES: ATP synthase F1 subunit delta [Enterococcus]|uniref:ATP synthase subunit delta n=1 Tax=Enterococcus sulfureus ATCC 49903 TaxID=1140003 RepID=S0KR32_9ENTE|nr:ATP synthase F1 subunit delta [Enterococcus sulfureus]EOT47087.1 ATP synthase F1, delta subunit [Enterococcus sulfureus ATCC 49903]EOT83618.1 ATP synthase F1, delta subunit [Enterococcus sulfureus ATCC 49903]